MMTPDADKPVLVHRMAELSGPMAPEPTEERYRLTPLPDVRAVLFDIYGTLFISASGDIGIRQDRVEEAAFVEALQSAGFTVANPTAGPRGVARLREVILRDHRKRRAEGIDYPEVDIESVWSDVIATLTAELAIRGPHDPVAVRRLAVEYECRVNPAWPMPEMEETVEALRAGGLVLGAVSNAQFYTPLLFDAFFRRSLEDFGFDPAACSWSYQHLVAKPSTRIYQPALDALKQQHGLAPHQALVVGNDVLNDITPAARLGCRTALFAGDRRSLRWRRDDERCTGVRADIVITGLRQLEDALGRS